MKPFSLFFQRLILITLLTLFGSTFLESKSPASSPTPHENITPPILKSQTPSAESNADKSLENLLEEAINYYNAKDFLSALNYFQQLETHFPLSEKLLFNLGLTYYELYLLYPESQLSYLAYAVSYFKKALLIEPQYLPALANLAFIQVQIFLSTPDTLPYQFIQELYEREQQVAFLNLEATPLSSSELFNFSNLRDTLKKYLLHPQVSRSLLSLIALLLISLTLLIILKLKAHRPNSKNRINFIIIPVAILYGLIALPFATALILTALEPTLPKEGVVQTKQTSLYLDPLATSPVIASLPEGTLLSLEIEREGWVQVSLSHTFKEWVNTHFMGTKRRGDVTDSATSPNLSSSSEVAGLRGWIPKESLLKTE